MSDKTEQEKGREEIAKQLTEEAQNMGLYDTPEDKIVRVLDKGFVRLVDSMGTDASIVQAARVSYGEGTKKVSEDEGLIRYLLRHKHTTPFEMVQFKFHIKAPIFVIRQWHRHRMWSYNEESGRYSEMRDEFYVPDYEKITKQNPNNKQGGTDEIILSKKCYSDVFADEQKEARQNYKYHLDTGMRKELARINLPLAQYSQMYGCVDLHNLFHFLKLRQDSHAQYEIRVYADAMLELIKPIVPIAVKAYEDYVLGSLTLTKKDVEALHQALLCVDSLFDTNAVPTAAKNIFSNKREREEFLEKIKKLRHI